LRWEKNAGDLLTRRSISRPPPPKVLRSSTPCARQPSKPGCVFDDGIIGEKKGGGKRPTSLLSYRAGSLETFMNGRAFSGAVGRSRDCQTNLRRYMASAGIPGFPKPGGHDPLMGGVAVSPQYQRFLAETGTTRLREKAGVELPFEKERSALFCVCRCAGDDALLGMIGLRFEREECGAPFSTNKKKIVGWLESFANPRL